MGLTINDFCLFINIGVRGSNLGSFFIDCMLIDRVTSSEILDSVGGDDQVGGSGTVGNDEVARRLADVNRDHLISPLGRGSLVSTVLGEHTRSMRVVDVVGHFCRVEECATTAVVRCFQRKGRVEM
jgi:hypothetical protein